MFDLTGYSIHISLPGTSRSLPQPLTEKLWKQKEAAEKEEKNGGGGPQFQGPCEGVPHPYFNKA